MFHLFTPPYPQSIYAQLPAGCQRYVCRSVQTRETLVSTLQETVVPAPAHPSQRQPYSGPGLRANIATTRVPAKKSSSPRASSGRQRYFKGLPTGVAACHRAHEIAQWPPRVPAHRGSWPHCPDQGHSKFISQTPLGPCSPSPGTLSHLRGKVPAMVRPGLAWFSLPRRSAHSHGSSAQTLLSFIKKGKELTPHSIPI